MANLIGKPHIDGRFKYYCDKVQPSQRITCTTDLDNKPITCITAFDDTLTDGRKKPDEMARAFQRTCFICHRYSPKTINMQWMCKKCEMPLCQIDQCDKRIGRTFSCIIEHNLTHNHILDCGFIAHDHHGFMNPDKLKVYSLTCNKQQKKANKAEARKRRRREAKEEEEEEEEVVVSPPVVRRTLTMR
jgi:hypothetical protein